MIITLTAEKNMRKRTFTESEMRGGPIGKMMSKNGMGFINNNQGYNCWIRLIDNRVGAGD